ncbi:hypothetical protein PLESTB_001766700 [Pleodorina starrii]|uniref:Uncharacterized protein n=1 Tax=Pleodorina starrii TaxID=330485 RepID=A0A9W6FAC2_9CHLO|nr:hypothetical protein PLESTM_001861900 [Pleodorina starrii]GLC61531.1 hypothetical protein PLESTB_001766700 [Pleodorina starrii]GLC76811.1 hypothetical protein PLESTF_001843700 [Pleodorina starrii]
MAKSTRSNAMKKLRTQRREQVEKQTAWIATAEEKRLAALAACMASAPVEPHEAPTTTNHDAMDTADKPTTVRVKKATKPLKGAVMKKGGKKKVSVLAGKNQFYKKGKKGQKGRR